MSRAFSGNFEQFLRSGTLNRMFAGWLSGQISRKSTALSPEIAEILKSAGFIVANLLHDAYPKCLTCDRWPLGNFQDRREGER